MRAKTFVLSMLTLAGLAVSAVPASAFWWHLRKHGHCNKYSTFIVCRPYNAFTPVFSGSLICDGCCPFSCPGGHGGASCSPVLGNPLLGGMCGHDMGACNAPFAGGAYAGGMHPSMWVGQPMPGPTLPAYAPTNVPPGPNQFAPPPPMPTNTQTYAPMNVGYPIQPANYQGQYYYPMSYPMQQQVPAYWYGN
jgi:hypothetical protein